MFCFCHSPPGAVSNSIEGLFFWFISNFIFVFKFLGHFLEIILLKLPETKKKKETITNQKQKRKKGQLQKVNEL